MGQPNHEKLTTDCGEMRLHAVDCVLICNAAYNPMVINPFCFIRNKVLSLGSQTGQLVIISQNCNNQWSWVLIFVHCLFFVFCLSISICLEYRHFQSYGHEIRLYLLLFLACLLLLFSFVFACSFVSAFSVCLLRSLFAYLQFWLVLIDCLLL